MTILNALLSTLLCLFAILMSHLGITILRKNSHPAFSALAFLALIFSAVIIAVVVAVNSTVL